MTKGPRQLLAERIAAIPLVTGDQFRRFKTLDEFRDEVLALILSEPKRCPECDATDYELSGHWDFCSQDYMNSEGGIREKE